MRQVKVTKNKVKYEAKLEEGPIVAVEEVYVLKEFLGRWPYPEELEVEVRIKV